MKEGLSGNRKHFQVHLRMSSYGALGTLPSDLDEPYLKSARVEDNKMGLVRNMDFM